MKAARVRAVARKEFLHIVRDRRSLALAIAIPLLQLLLFGYALTLDVDRVPTVVWDQSGSPASREFLAAFFGSRYFSLQGRVEAYRELERAIDTRQALVAIVIPADFARRLESRRAAQVQILLDGSDSNTATIARGYAEAVAESYSQAVAFRHLQRITPRRPEPPLELRARVWFNEELESRNYIIPGLMAIIMTVLAALLTSMTIAREWERGTMELLISTPLQGTELILGKLLPYFAIGLLDVSLAVLLGEFLFAVPLRGSVALLFAMAAVFLVGALSLGLLISILARKQVLANQVAMIVSYLPALLLSGFVFAIPNMPTPLQLITYVVPARYLVSLFKGIYLKGVGLEVLALEAFLMALFAAGMVLLARAKFRKKLE